MKSLNLFFRLSMFFFPIVTLSIERYLLTLTAIQEQLFGLLVLGLAIMVVSWWAYHQKINSLFYGGYFTALMILGLYNLALTTLTFDELVLLGFKLNAIQTSIFEYLTLKALFLYFGVLVLPMAYQAYLRTR